MQCNAGHAGPQRISVFVCWRVLVMPLAESVIPRYSFHRYIKQSSHVHWQSRDGWWGVRNISVRHTCDVNFILRWLTNWKTKAAFVWAPGGSSVRSLWVCEASRANRDISVHLSEISSSYWSVACTAHKHDDRNLIHKVFSADIISRKWLNDGKRDVQPGANSDPGN